jgi:hypothetical protein
MGRIAIAYLDCLEMFRVFNERAASHRPWQQSGLRVSGNVRRTIDLPSLMATPEGPLDFKQEVSMARLQELAATPPVIPEPRMPEPPATAAAPAAAPEPEAVEPPPAKQSWWKKVFG